MENLILFATIGKKNWMLQKRKAGMTYTIGLLNSLSGMKMLYPHYILRKICHQKQEEETILPLFFCKKNVKLYNQSGKCPRRMPSNKCMIQFHNFNREIRMKKFNRDRITYFIL